MELGMKYLCEWVFQITASVEHSKHLVFTVKEKHSSVFTATAPSCAGTYIHVYTRIDKTRR